MAMQFGDKELNHTVDRCFRPSVDRAGFDLRVLTDRQPAGLIDDQLRVSLRTSRFVIADLTHGNNGAYWEAGFAEGLGRPVIYTCRKAEWDERKTHFDTNHLVTIIWEQDKLEEASTRLTATIRATLPGEARMSD
jgi:nucleoside 2-deoxyribosyltransferase